MVFLKVGVIATILLTLITSPAEADDIVISVIQLSLTSVRVRWSPPSDGTSVSSYQVSYTDSTRVSQGTINVSQSGTSLDITDLIPEETYTFSVATFGSQGLLDISSMTVTLRQLNSPREVTVTAGEGLTVKVSWLTVENADTYTVTFNQVMGDGQRGNCLMSIHRVAQTVSAISGRGERVSASIPVGTNVNSATNDMLRAFTTYTAVVVAQSDTLGSSISSQSIFYTTQQIAASAAPEDVRVSVLNSTAIFVEWGRIEICRAANGRIVKYTVQYKVEPDGLVESVDRPGNRSGGENVSISGLTPFTVYSVQVAAVNENGLVGVFSNPKIVQTEEDVPGPVDYITAIPSFFKIYFKWRKPLAPNGIITSYTIHYESNSTSESSSGTVSGPQTCFSTPGGHEMGSEVNLTVVAFTSIGAGVPTTLTAYTLSRPPAVEARVVIALDDTSVSVYWNSLIIPDFDIDNYTVVYYQINSQTPEDREMTAVFPGSSTSAIITDLDPDLNYQFQVFATVSVASQSLEGERSFPPLQLLSVAAGHSQQEGGSHKDLSMVTYSTAFGVSGVIVGVVVGALSAAVITCKVTRTLSDRKKYESVNMSTRGPPVPSRNTSQPTVPAAPLPARRGRRLTERQGKDRGAPENSEGYGSREDVTENPAYGVNSLDEGEEGYTSLQPADPDEDYVTYY